MPPSRIPPAEWDTAAHRKLIPTSTTSGITSPSRAAALEIADRLVDSITDRFYLLATHPNIGRMRDEDLRPGLRSFPVGQYVILYRIEEADVLILRVLHGSRDIGGLFGH